MDLIGKEDLDHVYIEQELEESIEMLETKSTLIILNIIWTIILGQGRVEKEESMCNKLN